MRLTNAEKDLLKFLIKYPDQWHTYARDAKTRRAVAGLYMFKGLGIRGFDINRALGMMKLDSKLFHMVGKIANL